MTEWACPCGPHEEQLWDFWYNGGMDFDYVEIPLLCFRHGRHEPCRPCLREEEERGQTPL